MEQLIIFTRKGKDSVKQKIIYLTKMAQQELSVHRDHRMFSICGRKSRIEYAGSDQVELI